MTSKDSGKIALDEYEEFKMMNDFLSRIQVVNWLNTGIPPIFHDELIRLKEVVEAKGGALPLILQEMLNPENLGEMNIGVDLVKNRKPSNQKVMMPDWDSHNFFSRDYDTVGINVFPSYCWIRYCYPKLWKLILEARLGIDYPGYTPFGYVNMNWQQSEKFKELRGAIFSDSFIRYSVNDYKYPLEILENNTYQIGNEQVKYYMGEDKRGYRIKFKGASTINDALNRNYLGESYQLKRKNKDHAQVIGRFTDLPGVGKPKVEKWVELGLIGFIDLMAIMDGDVNNYKNLMILPGVGSEESCKKMIISQQFGEWNGNYYQSPEHYMKEV